MSPAIPKPALSQRLERRRRKAQRDTLDRRESEKVKLRSGGRCEAWVVGQGRCKARATEVHHLLGGRGRRGRGHSVAALHKQNLCGSHHRQITAHALVIWPVPGELPAWNDPYLERS